MQVQASLVENDDVVEALAANRTDDAFHVGLRQREESPKLLKRWSARRDSNLRNQLGKLALGHRKGHDTAIH